jgi:DNA-binding transcriptional MerR regulator
MSLHLMLTHQMIATEPSLADLAAASGIEARTIRSWVAQGLLPAPLTRGPAARYPTDTLDRVLAIRAMREVLGMPLTEIRKELLVSSSVQIRARANLAKGRTEDTLPSLDMPQRPNDASTALDYISELRARADLLPAALEAPEAVPPPVLGFAALEQRLSLGRTDPARKAKAEDWLRIPITPDVEFAVRAPLEPEQRALLERCADLIRDLLLGRDS